MSNKLMDLEVADLINTLKAKAELEPHDFTLNTFVNAGFGALQVMRDYQAAEIAENEDNAENVLQVLEFQLQQDKKQDMVNEDVPLHGLYIVVKAMEEESSLT